MTTNGDWLALAHDASAVAWAEDCRYDGSLLNFATQKLAQHRADEWTGKCPVCDDDACDTFDLAAAVVVLLNEATRPERHQAAENIRTLIEVARRDPGCWDIGDAHVENAEAGLAVLHPQGNGSSDAGDLS